MTFKSRVNYPYVITVHFGLFLLLGGAALHLYTNFTVWGTVIFVLLFSSVLLIVMLIWATRYDFHEQYLEIRAGLIKIRVVYDDVYMVQRFNGLGLFSGEFKLHLAGDGIEMFIRNGSFGNVRVSPRDEQSFISELRERARHAAFEIEEL
ncbi:PH domain-containing protein [Geomicrobium sp. JSM 1781026]|uniref:PH domain-containing protein n=1 Tax=Geomicrobium sp. JSM 1781026 TaxID=3344580 RepID=UPI0035BF7F82